MHLNNYLNFLWFLSISLSVGIGTTMLLRRLYREFQFFFAYTIFHVVRSLLLFAVVRLVAKPYATYFRVFWVSSIVEDALALAVIYEVLWHVFRDYEGIQGLVRLVFRWCAGLLVLLATISAATASQLEPNRIMSAVLSFDHGVAIVELGLLFLLFAFCAYFGLGWRHYVFGIAVGLALYTTIDLAVVLIRLKLGPVANGTLTIVNSAGYNCALMIWIAYLLSRDTADSRVRAVPKDQLVEWNRALMELMHK
jgi:hypothetical protein